MLISDLFTKWLQLRVVTETALSKLSKYCYEVLSSVFHLSKYVDCRRVEVFKSNLWKSETCGN